jgi:hypothetical protein
MGRKVEYYYHMHVERERASERASERARVIKYPKFARSPSSTPYALDQNCDSCLHRCHECLHVAPGILHPITL